MSIFSLLPDILPMILPSAVHVTKAEDLEAQRATGSNSGMVRQGAIVGKSDKMCATVLTAKARCASAVHHHGEQDTIIYAASGTGILMTNPGNEGELVKHELSPGDFAFVPPWTEHQEVNDTDEDVVWILIRNGPTPLVFYLEDWGGDEAKKVEDTE
ncbi:cupin domain-containing protein [Apiospora marii]|uniref:cupin domain-containing protein n=1 Tax=Apiospora marii TaxID=335849 RepID=UPI0031327520